MNLKNTLLNNDICTFQIDKNLLICGYSDNLNQLFTSKHILGESFKDLLEELFLNDVFYNDNYYLRVLKQIATIFSDKKATLVTTVVTNELSTKIFYHFSLGIDFVHGEKDYVNIRIAHFEEKNEMNQVYDDVFNTYPDTFSIYELNKQIGKFILDLNISKNQLYADKIFAKLLQIPVSKTNFYLITRFEDKFDGDHVLIREPAFFNRTDSLLSGELKEMEDEWFYNGRWLHVDIQVLKKNKSGKAEYIGGVIYDITESRKQTELTSLLSTYELAINVGKIGIFLYDLDKYTSKYFDANQIYADLIGLDKQENGYYLSDDFKKAVLSAEEEIHKSADIEEALDKLLSGNIEGTDNQILKINNLKTNKILYLLSSSRIEKRYENGDPIKIHGITIDVTERIKNERKQIEFANKDMLTGLANSRKLLKDMAKRHKGIGLFFDLDDFKKFNDFYGHYMGDQILNEFGQAMIEASLELPEVYIYRLYGDEFFVYAEGYDEDFAFAYEKRLIVVIEEKMDKFNLKLKLQASMGIAIFKDTSNIDDFIKEADYEMYKIKIDKKEIKK